jgi:O-antigen/teichoic acid export membrane protein
VSRVLGFANTLILARLLVPGDFGLVAIATGFSQSIQAFSSLGIDEAVIRQKSASRATYDTAFTINLIRGVATAVIVALCSWPMAQFFGDSRLVPVLWALAGCSLVTAFENIGTIEFRREFNFEREFRLLLLPRIASVTVTIVAGLIWRSHWALVAGIATNQILGIGLGYVMHSFRPRLGLSAWRDLAGFSFWSWAIGIATMVRDRVDSLVIGRFLGMAQVGTYSVGAELATLPTYELAAPLARACFPGFAAAARSGTGAEASYLRILASVSLVMLPAAAGIALVAGPATVIALGQGWDGAATVMRIMGFPGSLVALGFVSSTFLSAHGLLRQGFVISLLSMAVRTVAAITLVSQFGLIGAAAAHALTLAFENLSYMVIAFRRFAIPPMDLLRQVWRGALATAAMAIVLLATGLGADIDNPLRSLIEGMATGAAVYLVVLFGLWLACGRPSGGESDLMALVSRVAPVRMLERWAARLGF